jgi:hypothetical protein
LLEGCLLGGSDTPVKRRALHAQIANTLEQVLPGRHGPGTVAVEWKQRRRVRAGSVSSEAVESG